MAVPKLDTNNQDAKTTPRGLPDPYAYQNGIYIILLQHNQEATLNRGSVTPRPESPFSCSLPSLSIEATRLSRQYILTELCPSYLQR